jgi:hypothetical protein
MLLMGMQEKWSRTPLEPAPYTSDELYHLHPIAFRAVDDPIHAAILIHFLPIDNQGVPPFRARKSLVAVG